MNTPLIGAILLGGIVVMVAARAVRVTLALRRQRGGEAREYDMFLVAQYCENLAPPVAALPSQAWSDLDMDAVFQKTDRTTSWPGQHLFYARLRREDHSAVTLDGFENGVTSLLGDDTTRQRIRDALVPLGNHRASALPWLFQTPMAAPPTASRLAPLLSITALVCIAGAFRWPQMVLAVAACALVNAYVRVALRERMVRVLPAVRMLPAMHRAARTLAALDSPSLSPCTTALRTSAPRLHWISRAAGWLSFDPTGGNELVGYVYDYINLLLLLDVSLFVWAVDRIRTEGDTLAQAYAALGELDVLQAVATLRREQGMWARPEMTTSISRSLSFTKLVHPLLDTPVPNAIALDDQSVLLTGSNMSGKSTFLRTVGVNAVLARTIRTVFAETWRATPFLVRTSIGRADSILDGKSYYQAEVEGVRALLDPGSGAPRLVLIDELFRGTNSVERVAAAKAVLAQLERNGDQVIVATHDVELLDLLPEYTTYHFREEVRDGELTFDYLLHSGACATRNALAILALNGYPPAVVDDATETADRIGRRAGTDSVTSRVAHSTATL
ncbi:MAG: hypothetical protein ABJE47_16160 [bacterium]